MNKERNDEMCNKKKSNFIFKGGYTPEKNIQARKGKYIKINKFDRIIPITEHKR